MQKVDSYEVEVLIEGLFEGIDIDSNEQYSRMKELKMNLYDLYSNYKTKPIFHIYMEVMLLIIMFLGIINMYDRMPFAMQFVVIFLSLAAMVGNWYWYCYEMRNEETFYEELVRITADRKKEGHTVSKSSQGVHTTSTGNLGTSSTGTSTNSSAFGTSSTGTTTPQGTGIFGTGVFGMNSSSTGVNAVNR